MSEFPQAYRKGDRVKVANNVRQKVALEFAGFKPEKVEAPAPAAVEPVVVDAPAEEGVDSWEAELPAEGPAEPKHPAKRK